MVRHPTPEASTAAPWSQPLLSRRALTLAMFSTGVLTLAGCAGGGSSDVVVLDGAGPAARSAAATGTLNLFGYGVAKSAYDKVIPGFLEIDPGVTFQQSYGPSGDQSRKVAAGAPADIVSFSVEPEITDLVEVGLVRPDWKHGTYQGVPFGSVITLVVRQGNPKGIRDWADLLRPGIEVVTPNPFSSGSAKWNLLAPYAVLSRGGQDAAAGLAYVEALITDHVTLQPASGREATEAFLQGSGDVLISYENEALTTEGKGEPVEHVTPPQTFKVECPVAIVTTAKNPTAAAAFLDYLYSAPAQTRYAEAGFRPVDRVIAADYADKFPAPDKVWTVADLGGWDRVETDLFDKDTGTFATIYAKATQ